MAAPKKPRELFNATLTAAINDLMERGFDSQARVDEWVRKLEIAARATLVPEITLERSLRDMLTRVYQRAVDGDRLLDRHEGVSQFTLANVKPKLRAELDRRILASSSLIRLNRQASIQRTLQRFQGWATSVPIGGTEVGDRAEVKDTVKRGISGLPFEERRVIIDQGHKLASTINEIVAVDGGAIAGVWDHVMEGGGYQARPVHEKRNNEIFVVRDNWAMKKGLMKLAGRKYTDQVEAPAELPFCRCAYTYLYNLRDLPTDMVTAKGKEELAQVRQRLASMM